LFSQKHFANWFEVICSHKSESAFPERIPWVHSFHSYFQENWSIQFKQNLALPVHQLCKNKIYIHHTHKAFYFLWAYFLTTPPQKPPPPAWNIALEPVHQAAILTTISLLLRPLLPQLSWTNLIMSQSVLPSDTILLLSVNPSCNHYLTYFLHCAVVEYLVPSSGKLYHHKMKILNLRPTSNSEDVLESLQKKHPTYFSGNKLNDEQILSNLLILKVKLNMDFLFQVLLTNWKRMYLAQSATLRSTQKVQLKNRNP